MTEHPRSIGHGVRVRRRSAQLRTVHDVAAAVAGALGLEPATVLMRRPPGWLKPARILIAHLCRERGVAATAIFHGTGFPWPVVAMCDLNWPCAAPWPVDPGDPDADECWADIKVKAERTLGERRAAA